MKNFLRYNGRHCLWFAGWWSLPKLNPISSSYGRGEFDWHEPLWFMRLRVRLFGFAGRQRCGRRTAFSDRVFPGRYQGDPLPDTWDRGPDGNRTCSHCGSIHPEDLMEICRKTLVDERYGVEATTKSYKVYVRQPGVLNSGMGAIKFYKCHVPPNPSEEDKTLFSKAMAVTDARFMAQWTNTCVAPPTGDAA